MDQFNIFDVCYPMVKLDKPIRLIELFAGYGSQSMALERLGVPFEHYRCVEWDKYAVASFNAIHGTNFPPMDIKNVHAADLGVVDTDNHSYIMFYSFPCTDLSLAGTMKGIGKECPSCGFVTDDKDMLVCPTCGAELQFTRSGLLHEVERLIREMDELPQILVMENVPQIHAEKNIKHFNEWIKFLELKGYSNYYEDLNAKDYGVAQNRVRCFMVSILGKYNFKFPKEMDLRNVVMDYLEDDVDEKYYLTGAKVEKLIQELVSDGELDKECARR